MNYYALLYELVADMVTRRVPPFRNGSQLSLVDPPRDPAFAIAFLVALTGFTATGITMANT